MEGIKKFMKHGMHTGLYDALSGKKRRRKKKKMSKKAALREVYSNVPRSVIKSGKTGKAKRDMLFAIAMSKSGMSRK